MRLITSTPQATATSTTPAADERRWPGWWPAGSSRTGCRPWWRRTESGSPAVSHAVRAMLKRLLADLADAAADDLADLGRVDAGAARRSSRWTVASRSAGWTLDSPPPRRPTGVRTASTITTLVIAAAYEASDGPSVHAEGAPVRPDCSCRPTRPAIVGSPAGSTSRRDEVASQATRRPADGMAPALPRHARHGGLLGASTSPTTRPTRPTRVLLDLRRLWGRGAELPVDRRPAGPCSSWPGAAPTATAGAAARRPSAVPGDRAMRCPGCGLLAYPRLAPAVIALVHRPPRTGGRGVAGPGRAVRAADVLLPGRLRRAGRDPRGRGAPRGARGGRRAGGRRALPGLASRGRSRTR